MCTTNAISAPYHPTEPLGLIAGAGNLPLHIIAAAQERHQPVAVVAIEGQTPQETVKDVPHLWCRFGAVGEAITFFQQQGVTQLVMAGRMKRPSLTSLYPDAKGRALLKQIGGSLIAGDDMLLSRIAAFLETEGFRIVGAHEICKHLLAEEGILTKAKPSKAQRADAFTAIKVLKALAPYDIGQAAVIADGHILGIEAAEGTDGLIRRCASYEQSNGGILVKMPKIGQNLRTDMPAVGVDTILALYEGRFSGVYLAADATLMIGKSQMIELANRHKLFIQGIVIDEFAD